MCARLQLGDGDRAALNLYANEPGAFDEADMAAASVIAPYAALSIEHALRGITPLIPRIVKGELGEDAVLAGAISIALKSAESIVFDRRNEVV